MPRIPEKNKELVLVEHQGPVALVTMNNPATSNAMDEDMGPRLTAVLEELAVDESVRALVLTGAGGVFTAGGNLINAHQYLEANPGSGGARVFAGYTKWVARVLAALTGMAKPVICAVDGAASGAGLAWLLAADLVVAADSARILPGFVAVGLVPAAGTTWHLPRLMGHPRAAETLMLNQPISLQEALELGLVHQVTSREEVVKTALARAQELAAQPAGAAAATKQSLRRALGRDLLSHAENERRAVLAAAEDDDFRRLVSRFADKSSK